MSFSPTDSHLFAPLFSSAEMAEVFSDAAFVRTLVEVEGALARAQGRIGIIPAPAAERVAAAARALEVDFKSLRAATENDGFPIIALVGQLCERVGGEAASYVHWGATTQDIMDTALMLQVRRALGVLEPALLQLTSSLARLADKHRHSLMAGRTHAQQALPITFGLKVASWLAPLLRHKQRLGELKPRVLVVQFGGAAGTLASLGASGLAVQEALAAELNLGVPLTPWHTQRDGVVELAGWLSLVSGSLAKMAQDVILMAQSEVAELQEGDRSRGGSSTMPQKSNPVQSELIIAAARANASLLAAMHHALVQEHERATHGWQLEWLSLPQMFALTASCLNKAVWLGEHLAVDEARMRENVRASNGLMLAEAASFALASHMSRAEAKGLVKEAVAAALAENRHLVEVLREKTDAPIDWQSLQESDYLGSSQAFIDRVLAEAGKE